MAKVLSNNIRAYLDAYELVLGGREISVRSEVDPLDQTDLNDSAPTHLVGLQTAGLDFSGLWDDSATGAQAALAALLGSATTRIATVHYGSTIGDRVALLQVTARDYRSEPRHAELVPLKGEFVGQAAAEWARVLYPKTTVTATTNGGSHDRGGGAAASLVWAYHIIAFSATGGNARWQLILQTDDNSGFTTPATLETVNITAVGAARRSVGASAERYVRLVPTLDATSGSLTVAAVSS